MSTNYFLTAHVTLICWAGTRSSLIRMVQKKLRSLNTYREPSQRYRQEIKTTQSRNELAMDEEVALHKLQTNTYPHLSLQYGINPTLHPDKCLFSEEYWNLHYTVWACQKQQKPDYQSPLAEAVGKECWPAQVFIYSWRTMNRIKRRGLCPSIFFTSSKENRCVPGTLPSH